MLQQAALAIIDPKALIVDEANPKVIEAAKIFHCTPTYMVKHIEGRLKSQVSRNLYLKMGIAGFTLAPKHFRELMVAFLGREPGPQELRSIPDPKHPHVSTSDVTRLLELYLTDVLDVLDDAKDGGIKINHLQASWLVITCHTREGALSKLEELRQKYPSNERLLTAMKRMMRATPNFKELLD